MYDKSLDPIMREVFNDLERLINSVDSSRKGDERIPMTDVADRFNYIARRHRRNFSEAEVAKAAEWIYQELYELGPMTELLERKDVTDIMVNAPDEVWVEVSGKLVRSNVHFLDDDHIRKFIRIIATRDGARCDPSSPLCNCMLVAPGKSYDRTRANLTMNQVSIKHPTITLRKHTKLLSMDEMLALGTLDERCRDLLSACVRGRLNILVIGGTGSGKTSMLNALSEFIPNDQRIITIEDNAELRLKKSHVLTMQARPANAEGAGAVTIRDIFVNTLRQRPDRIIVGECRGGEAIDMLEAMSTGHDGSLTTIHANNARDSVTRIEVMASMDNMDLPDGTVSKSYGLAIDLVVTTKRYVDGSRKISEIVEVGGYDPETKLITMSPLIEFKQAGLTHNADGSMKLQGGFVGTGSRLNPNHLERLEANGEVVDPRWFAKGA